MKKILALGCISAAGVVSALVTPLFIASAVPPAKPSPTPTPTPTPTVAPYTPAYEVVTFVQLVSPGGSGIREARCPAGKSVTGGGYWTDMPPQQAWYLDTSESRPNVANQSWEVKNHVDPNAPINPVTLTIYAVCANTQ